MQRTPNILFLCTGNSCRSQMAEGWARQLLGDRAQVYSAGIETHGLNPQAVRAMQHHGVDISEHHSKTVGELEHIEFDTVVTVCDHAAGCCPTFSGATNVLHHPFDDPPALAKQAASDEEAFGHYLRVCGEIRRWVLNHPHIARPHVLY